MLAAPALAVLTLATLANSLDPLVEPVILGGAAAGGIAVLALAWLVHRRPIALALLVVAALPFRVPVSIGDSAANLLLPLYAVIAAGTLSYAWRALRRGGPDAEREPLLRRLAWAFAAVLALYGLQASYSADVEQAIKNICLFYVPFALLFLLLLEVRVERAAVALVAGGDRRPRARVRRDRLRRVRHRPPADHQRQGRRGQRPAALLPGQLAVLRPQHLRPLPGADHDPAGRRPAVDAPAARRDPDRARARAAVGGARVLALAVELRRAAARPRRAGRAALEAVAGAGRRRARRDWSRSGWCCSRPPRSTSRPGT